MGERLKPPRGFVGLYERRVARKRRRCDSCGRTIEPGESYVRGSVPPGSDLDNERWWTSTGCGMSTSDCPRYWDVDSRIATGVLADDDDLVVAAAGPRR